MLLGNADRATGDSGVTDGDVVAAAETLGEKRPARRESSSELPFTAMPQQCNEAISDQPGIEHDSVCGDDVSYLDGDY